MGPENDNEDRALADAVGRSGDERAFRTLYRRHTPRLYAVLSRLMGETSAEAEDLVQETWIRAVESVVRFRWDAAFSTWLIAIGVNVARDALRRRGRRLEDTWEDGFEIAVVEAPHADRVDLERAIQQLPDGARAVLVLHDIEGWPHESIAERLGVTVGTSKSQLHRARRTLRNWLEPQPEGHRM
jgi:RNA polymerase sigma factor (sigma-70 family)